jgi:hypothetical protein
VAFLTAAARLPLIYHRTAVAARDRNENIAGIIHGNERGNEGV